MQCKYVPNAEFVAIDWCYVLVAWSF